MRRHVETLRPPVPVIAATLLGWGIIAVILIGRLALFASHVVHTISGAL